MLSLELWGEARVPLNLQQRPQGTSRVASGESGLPSSCKGELRIPRKSLQGNRVGNSGFLSNCDRDLGVPLELQQGSQALSHVESWKSTFPSSCERNVRSPVELR